MLASPINMRWTKKTFLVIAISVFSSLSVAEAQTCSCAGAPLLGAQSTTPVFGGDMIIGLTHEYHDISNLHVDGSRASSNRSTERVTQSTLLEAHYGISSKFSLSGTFTYVHKERTTGIQTDSPQSLSVAGVGDALLLAKYQLFNRLAPPAVQWKIGAGGKIPLGRFNVRNNDFLLNADMQPGTGAWDGIVWSQLTSNFELGIPWNLFLVGSYRQTGSAERFGSNDNYKFGNELLVTTGNTAALGKGFSYTGMMQYRSTSSDQRNEIKQPNTGGYWYSLINRIGYSFSERVSTNIDFRIPISENLNGLQPTTSYAASASIFINLSERPDRIF